MQKKFKIPKFEDFLEGRNTSSAEQLTYSIYCEYLRMANVIWELQDAVGGVQSNMMSMADAQKTFNESTIEALNNLVKVDSVHHETIKIMNKNIKFNHDVNWFSILLHGVWISYILLHWGKV